MQILAVGSHFVFSVLQSEIWWSESAFYLSFTFSWKVKLNSATNNQ